MMKCSSINCENEASTLKCPICLKFGVTSVFCSQDCFKKNWSSHKQFHLLFQGTPTHKPGENYDPFPPSAYTGPLRALYPLSDTRKVPSDIPFPDYALDGIPKSERKIGHQTIILDDEHIEKMRYASVLAREILDITAEAIKPGVTTDELDEICHNETIKRKGYPSPLNYYHFPKSLCTSVNEVICHGIPDKRPLETGDIINLDVTIYINGVHSDMNATYFVGGRENADADTIRLVDTTRASLAKAISICKPGTRIRDIGKVIEAVATEGRCSIVKNYVGHGVNQMFHCAPNIPHYANNKAPGVLQEGMTFTIEPMLALGTGKDKTWPDHWTAVTQDGKRSAQFEHTLLVTATGVEILTDPNGTWKEDIEAAKAA
ncbi:hypothetical protein CANCADRAFT_75421 [Tortispora caseinolytica NRRL Y-17796]|uniref:Methionine aminopeptidase n=1 Tax=Tortispora caseinolytica NRRL Y-17796 TaxID=767744 RepID=A0A1E4TJ12_9ASCO|nr:hypothetical protein CANCADRAFT_75421 [Tortispora caseinolytica NRRL Y-17796]